jgi:hypothetical protein
MRPRSYHGHGHVRRVLKVVERVLLVHGCNTAYALVKLCQNIRLNSIAVRLSSLRAATSKLGSSMISFTSSKIVPLALLVRGPLLIAHRAHTLPRKRCTKPAALPRGSQQRRATAPLLAASTLRRTYHAPFAAYRACLPRCGFATGGRYPRHHFGMVPQRRCVDQSVVQITRPQGDFELASHYHHCVATVACEPDHACGGKTHHGI